MASAQGARLGANLLLAAVSLFFLCLLLAGLEGVLRVAGLGDPDASRASRLKYQQIYLPILEPGTRPDGTRVFRTVDSRLPYQSILAQKPVDGLRVFTFGGSATAGLGYSPNVTFSRHLERMLRRAYPERTVEVVNLGIVALSSRQVKLLVADVVERFDPDLLVVYSGNNEFLEIHGEKYARAHETRLQRWIDPLRETNLYRLLSRAVRGAPVNPSLADQDFSHDDLRLTQDAIIQHIRLEVGEVDRAVDRYAANVEEIARSAKVTGTALVLLSVASNWKWRGRSDLPDDWRDELGSNPAQIRAALDDRIAAAAPDERHAWLFKRATLHEEQGNTAAARADYREAMNSDPHLRRALDVMNERVARVAQTSDVAYLDLVAALGKNAKNGIIGFGEFYDYVHFTPRGAVLVAGAVFGEARRRGLLPEGARLDAEDYVAEQTAKLADASQDFLAADEWLGIGFDPERLSSRDLWKYDEMLAELDRRLEQDPRDVRARVYRGNARSFQPDEAAGAAEDYRKALEAGGANAVIQRNLDALLLEREDPG
jgi:lysophospholipase L1-like esterase